MGFVNNPFDLANYQRQINWCASSQAYKNSIQQSAVVNGRRAKGHEPSAPYSSKGRDTEPEKFALKMPKMPKHDRNAARRQRTKEKREMAEQKHKVFKELMKRSETECGFDPTKFAELIVRECLEVVQQHWITPDEDAIADAIRQHFGVQK
ncbi:hypothetical protein UFOVP652_37 [uncultured Caudovirales phage]|uniref:Uncharacterized protein n=1 Tax=uncultured Caudovirales phage TaxID=2100421 RepID=A0A6J5N5S3_9CAUD|nr:hypothetical protein UFOVP652_37 [uncultured Caudovirales phage]CAB5223754.1 hypothetical protein UFOVP734_2 [uncultured Caudovirales phage]